MSILATQPAANAVALRVSDDSLFVQLDDGRTISAPDAWYPRLLHGSQAERNCFEQIGDGEGIHWPQLGEDVSVGGLLAGRRSAESDVSLDRWLQRRLRI